MKIITISTLFPNANDPKHGIFVLTRLRHLLKDCSNIQAKVIAPVPWFPLTWKIFGQYAKYANVPEMEIIHGIEVHHPRYLVLPKIGMHITHFFLYRAISKTLKRLLPTYQADVIDGHYFFPDGVAIAKAASKFNLPFTCTARGTDINLIPQYPVARKLLQDVFNKASHMMSVCKALKDEMVSLGVKEESVTVLRNGVDLTLFKASSNSEQIALKKAQGIDKKLILSVGWLVERKGHHLVIEAIAKLPDIYLVIVGEGPEEGSLKKLAADLGVTDRVIFTGPLLQAEVNKWMQTADMLVLASSREGWANVLLESMASGTPVVATKVWGTPEVVQNESVGVLVDRSAQDIRSGIAQLAARKIERHQVRAYAEQFDWTSTSLGQEKIFSRIIEQ